MVETTDAVTPKAPAVAEQTFVIRYEDADFVTGEMRCQAPNAAIALSAFRQRFRGFSNARVLNSLDIERSVAGDLQRLRRGIASCELPVLVPSGLVRTD